MKSSRSTQRKLDRPGFDVGLIMYVRTTSDSHLLLIVLDEYFKGRTPFQRAM